MKLDRKVIILLFFICSIFTLTMVFLSEYSLAVFGLVFTLFTTILLFINNKNNKNPYTKFKSEIMGIIKTYDSILVNILDLPNLEEKKIVNASSFRDLVNAEYEFKKPIFYIFKDDYAEFILINKEEAYVLIKKYDDEMVTPLEEYLAELEKNSDVKEYEKFNNLDKTGVFVSKDDKEYKVSPVWKKEKLKSLNDKEEVNNAIDEEFALPKRK